MTFFQNVAKEAFAINIYETYYVLALRDLALLLAVIYFLTGDGYWFVLKMLRKPLVRLLTLIHCLIMFGWFVVFGCILFYSKVIITSPFPLYNNDELISKTVIIIGLVIGFIAQPIFFANLLGGIFRKKRLIAGLIGFCSGIVFSSCGLDEVQKPYEVYNEKANELIFQKLEELACNCLLEIPQESLLEISKTENPTYDMRSFVSNELNVKGNSSLDSLVNLSKNFKLDPFLIKKNDVKIITLKELMSSKKDPNTTIFSSCPKGIICMNKPIFDENFEKSIFEYNYAFTCVRILPPRVYVWQKEKWKPDSK